jgi:hypothetical protein
MKMNLFQKQYPILGIMMNFMTSSKDALFLVEERFDYWKDLPTQLIRPDPAMIIKINELPNTYLGAISEEVHFKIENEILTGSGPGFEFHVDRKSGIAEVWLESEVLKLASFFKHNILGAIVRFLVFSKDRVPLHASTIIRDETALILYGQSGSGKSTLSYQLLKQGADILSESAVFIASEGGHRLWGDIQDIYLRPDAKGIFPELANYPEKTLPNGKTKIPVHLPVVGTKNQRRLYFSGPMILIILERSEDSHSRLLEINHHDAINKLIFERESGFDLSDKFEDTVKQLPVINTYVLKSGNDLIFKAEMLEKLCKIKSKRKK